MTKDFLAGVRELIFQDIPDYIREALKFLWRVSAPVRSFAVERALILTTATWLLLISIILLCLPFGEDRNPLNPSHWLGRNDATGLRDYLWAMSFPLGALLVSLTLVNALRRTRIMDIQATNDKKRAQTAERELEANISSKRDELNISTFTKSVGMLDSDRIMTRVGAIYSLEEILRTSALDPQRHLFAKQIADTLCAFAREKLNLSNKDIESKSTDTIAALTAISRSWPDSLRNEKSEDALLRISNCDLREILSELKLNMNYINFSHSIFGRTWQALININGSVFSNCRMKNLDFILVKFNDCNFFGADFGDSEISICEFKNCNFSFTKGEDVNFRESKFINCRYYDSSIKGARIDSCVFIFESEPDESEQDAFLNFLSNSTWSNPPTVPNWAQHLVED